MLTAVCQGYSKIHDNVYATSMFETPVYKVLAANDTGQAPGHQGGIVIPAAIEEFFPDVVGTITPSTPTADVNIDVDLVVDGVFLGRSETRFQYQTWGGTRSPERRLTGGLGVLRNAAQPDDLVLFSRDPAYPERMQLTLLRKGSGEYAQVVDANNGRRWGLVQGLPEPVKNSEIRTAESDLAEIENGEFSAFDTSRRLVERPTKIKARATAFRRMLISRYGKRCLATAETIIDVFECTNIDAAHVVPIEVGGSDDIRNGLVLSKDMHWAFDRGLFTVRDDLSIQVSNHALQSLMCEPLKRIHDRPLEFGQSSLRPHRDALNWHRHNRFLG